MEINDTLINYGGTIKTLERKGDIVTVGDYGILWGDQSRCDLVGDWFTKETGLGARKGLGVDTMLHHGLPLSDELAEYATQLLPPTVKSDVDDTGLFVATLLDLRKAYDRKVFAGVDQSLLSWSSGANPRGVKRRDGAKTGEIMQWPIMEFSFTPTPCEPRMRGISTLKALAEIHDDATHIKAVRVLTDFTLPEPQEIKSEFLGDYVEADMAMAGLSRLNDALMWRVVSSALSPSVYPADEFGFTAQVPISTNERIAKVRAAFDEYSRLALEVIERAIQSPETAEDAAKSLREIFADPDLTNSISNLEAGQHEGSRFLDHSKRVLAANEEYVERTKDLLSNRASSRKSGRVLSAEKHRLLSEHRDGLQTILDELNTLLEAHHPNGNEKSVEASALRSQFLRLNGRVLTTAAS